MKRRISKIWFWILSLTWGFTMTLIGAVAFGVACLTKRRIYRHQYGYVIEIGEGWGGLSMGPFIFVSKNSSERLLNHEFGHSLQNCYLGPYMLIISLASAARYWYREYLTRKNPDVELPLYDDIWFEGTATYLGQHFADAA